MDNKTRKIVLSGLMIALVCVATMSITIPTPGTNGYVNIGDSMIFLTSILLGPIPGMIAGGIGSAMADILSGYTHWALFTLIIKGLEGYVVGLVVRNGHSMIKNILGTTLGAIVMVVGYFLAGGILEGSLMVSLTSVPSNMVQGISSIIIALPIAYALLSKKSIRNFISTSN